MSDIAETDSPFVQPPNPARVYRDYLLTCRRLGITPTSPERAKALLAEWMQAQATGRAESSLTQ